MTSLSEYTLALIKVKKWYAEKALGDVTFHPSRKISVGDQYVIYIKNGGVDNIGHVLFDLGSLYNKHYFYDYDVGQRIYIKDMK